MGPARLVCVALFLSAAVGCISSQEKAAQLSGVAKGWCLNIRASQVIPVYPLTEDVEVGDLYVVQRPIEDEVDLYNSQGFLPLGHHLTRLSVDGFDKYYAHNEYGVDGEHFPPMMWRAAVNTSGSAATQPTNGADNGERTNWAAAPRAAFPAYSFEIGRDAAANVNLPIQGIPVAFGALGSSKATASVTLSDAYTYGLDEARLFKAATHWAECHRALLAQYSPIYQPENFNTWSLLANTASYRMNYSYLRVITRVYFVKKVNVSMVDTSEGGGEASVGLPTPANLIGAGGSYDSLLQTLNKGLAGGAGSVTTGAGDDLPKDTPAPKGSPAPKDAGTSKDAGKSKDAGASKDATTSKDATVSKDGASKDATQQSQPGKGSSQIGGSLKFAAMVNRGVSMDQTFDRPLTIGYLAFDIPIGFEGNIGHRPVSTTLRLERPVPAIDAFAVARWASLNPNAYNELVQWVGTSGSANWRWLEDHHIPTRVNDFQKDGKWHKGLIHYLCAPPAKGLPKNNLFNFW